MTDRRLRFGRFQRRRCVCVASLIGVIIAGSIAPVRAAASSAPSKNKVVVFGIASVAWKDIYGARAPTLRSLIGRGAIGDVSVRIQNLAGQGYAGLGAGLRVQTDASSAFAFNLDEMVENSHASDLFFRKNGFNPQGEVAVISVGAIRRANSGKAFDAKAGLIAQHLASQGRAAAVIGNADESIGPLPKRLPTPDVMLAEPSPDTGVHREAALAAMREDGTVSFGKVDRTLLKLDPHAPFGLASSAPAYAAAFRQALTTSDFIVVETGDTMRADIYASGLAKEQRIAARKAGIERADRLIGTLLRSIDTAITTVVIVAPTTPGGNLERGQLRPVIIVGPGISHGLLTSTGTRRRGLISMSDLSATIAKQLGLAGEVFAGGHAATVKRGPASVPKLIDANLRSMTHDAMRTPVSVAVVSSTFVLYLVALYRWKKNRLTDGVVFFLLAAISFPVATFIPRAGFYRAGAWLASASIILGTLMIAGLLASVTRRSMLWCAGAVMAITGGFYIVDLTLGAPYQLDSLYGYTSVAAGRFFGLGNLGFA
ncbi:MAG: hypothetical protein LC723_07280, partial [Actinobacteria bacterium]|nr:hypothetical protein [Actinomycetota bacterium]